jgi:methyltransferase
MGINIRWYTLFLAAVGVGRLIELRISRRHQHALAGRGIEKIPEPHFRLMVLLHAGVLLASGLEVQLLRRPFRRALALPAGAIIVLANALRWWVIRTMAGHWNVQVINSLELGVVADGPFRWIRHPNYAAVFLEMTAIPLLHGAWLTALIGTFAHIEVLRRRIATEEAVLLADPAYRAVMGPKPRFLPKVRLP